MGFVIPSTSSSPPNSLEEPTNDRRFSISPARLRPAWLHWRLGVFCLSGVMLLLLLIFWFRPPLVQEPLWTGTVQVGDLKLGVSGFGKLAPIDMLTLSAAASGTVESIQAQVGFRLAKGDPIITLRSPELRQQLAIAERSYAEKVSEQARLMSEFAVRRAEIKNQLSNAQDSITIESVELKAHLKLEREGLISQILLARQQNKVALAQHQVEQARANLKAIEEEERIRTNAVRTAVRMAWEDVTYAREQVNALVIRAREPGVLLDLPETLTVGAPVSAGMVLAKISTSPTLGAEIVIPANEANRLMPGMPAEIYLEERLLRGKLLRINPRAQQDQVRAYIGIEASNTEGFLPGQAVTAEIITETAHGAVYIQKPEQVTEQSIQTLYEVDRTQGLLHRREVKFGKRAGRYILVESGVAPGREVVLGDLSRYQQARTLRFQP